MLSFKGVLNIRHRFDHMIIVPDLCMCLCLVCMCVFLYIHACMLVYMCVCKKKEIFYLMTYSTHFIYGYIVLDIW